ncbi:PE family protein [Mycolicibacterium canariasense]|uniref:PE family protein n=1 Tax=Mycolicibacterium canariasense TaxID=228230 RepID=A0A100WH28_MYCCR|nr:hypothetical protein [Mycolicibacterium canariasense]MCV7212376.1 hypothetical protein [Mycolicibacterium canariasense]ORV15549.1 hypothetical protein AWB94_04080 [Mycolicibacterium canariasense]GAS98050.1 PE family protein [Mycolicibacterium canariasense]
MRVSVRSYLMAGVAALAAGTVAIPPSITPPAQPQAPVHTQVRLAAETRTAWAPRPVIALIPKAAGAAAPATPVHTATAGTTTAAPSAAPAAATVAPKSAALAFPGLSNAIIDGYNWAIGWVDYGVDLAQYAVGWIPVANIFAPQIGIVYYNLIEPILTSAVYNTAYVIGGQVDLIQGISNVINDSVTAGRGFIQAEINWALSWLPPLPPVPLATTATTTMAKTTAVSLAATAEPTDGKPPVTAEQQTDHGSEHETQPVETEPVATRPAETEPTGTPTTDSTPVKEPGDTATSPESPPTPESPKTPESAAPDQPADTAAPATKPATTKPDTDKPDTTKPDTQKADTDKAGTKAGTEKTDKADTEKPAPKKAEPKKKKRDRPSAGESAPKADTHAGSDAN